MPVSFNASFTETQDVNATFNDPAMLESGMSDATEVEVSNVRIATTAEWDAQTTLISGVGIVYMYTDHMTDQGGNPIPGFKVGDGTSYLIDMPFNDDIMVTHMADSSIHVTQAEKDKLSEMGALAYADDVSATYTPDGSVSAPAITPTTDTVDTMTDAGTLPNLSFTVQNENLTIEWSAGTLPTKGSKTVMTGATAGAPVFTGTTSSIVSTAS